MNDICPISIKKNEHIVIWFIKGSKDTKMSLKIINSQFNFHQILEKVGMRRKGGGRRYRDEEEGGGEIQLLFNL